MSKCHVFSVDDAVQYGVEKAVILQNIRFWLEKVKANDKDEHKHDGYYWTYNSARAFAEIFPYYNKSKVHRLLTQLEEDGVIISGNFNKAGYDRTKWYSMPEFSISNNCNTQIAEVQNGNSESATPIPYVITDVNPDVNPNTLVSEKKETKKTVKYKPEKPDNVSEQVWHDLLILRKETKASNSKTAWTTVFNGLNAAQQATGHSLDQIITFWIGKAWKGFNADWYLNAQPKPQQTNYQGNNHANHQSANSQHNHFDQLRAEARAKYGNTQPNTGELRTVN